MDEGSSYITFVWSAYAVAFAILGGVTVSSVLEFIRLKRQEKKP